ncbi:hypothetical protein QBC44DRAFT_357086 [Cladorrhinum sp. PSN332]|nr:hypothetical protein QBC44DRAFT_357086 [Cladorrhinum sp. PSN332]
MRQQLAGPLLGLAALVQLGDCKTDANVLMTLWQPLQRWFPLPPADGGGATTGYDDYKEVTRPWQAPAVIHMPRGDIRSAAGLFAMWPSPWTTISEIPETDQDGRQWAYDGDDDESQETGNKTEYRRTDYFGNYTVVGYENYAADVGVETSLESTGVIFLNKTPIAKIQDWKHTGKLMSGAKKYRPPVVGNLALAPLGGMGILEQLSSGPSPSIGSNSFSLRVPSPNLNQTGAFILGGYSQHRAAGRVRRYDLALDGASGLYFPQMALQDIRVSVELGGLSPWAESLAEEGVKMPGQPRNVFVGAPLSPFRGTGKKLRAKMKKRQNPWDWADPYAWVAPDPTLPDIYLPPGNCENLAAGLPVTYSPSLDTYLWNTSSPLYKRIVSTPTFLVFTLGSPNSTEKNLDIKVPFKLLSLEVDPPLGEETTAHYFPCRSIHPPTNLLDQSTFVWRLGRAFLQAAYLAVDYERNVTYLAQAVGPSSSTSDDDDDSDDEDEGIHVLGENGMEFTEPESAFMESWKEVLIPIPSSGSNSGKGGLSKAAIAGILLGCVIVVLVVVLWGLKLKWARQEERRKREAEQGQSGGEGGGDVEGTLRELNLNSSSEPGGGAGARRPKPEGDTSDDPPPVYSEAVPARHSRLPDYVAGHGDGSER